MSEMSTEFRSGRVWGLLATLLVIGGISGMAVGWSGYAVSRELSRTDALREADLDRKLLGEARQLVDSAQDRLSLAAAWAQAEQMMPQSSTAAESEEGGAPPSLQPPVARWHLGSTVLHETQLSGATSGQGLMARLGNADWVASRLSDGNLQIVSKLQATVKSQDKGGTQGAGTDSGIPLLVSRWKEGVLSETLTAQAARSDASTIRARLWLSAEESLGTGSERVDSNLLRAIFSGEKLRGYGWLDPANPSASRRMAFDRAAGGSVVATVDAPAPAPALAWGWIQASNSTFFIAVALLGGLLSGLGAVGAMQASRNRVPARIAGEPSIAAAGPVVSASAPARVLSAAAGVSAAPIAEPVVETPASRIPARAEKPKASGMGLGAESAGAPVFLPTAIASTSGIETDAEPAGGRFEETADLRLKVAALERELEAARRMIRVMQEEDRVVFEFERDAVTGRDPRLLGDRLAKSASKLCGGPALFFQFQSPLGALALVADSGLDQSLVPAQLHVPLDSAACERISELAQEGAIPSLSGYEPLAQAVLRNFGASHYDAWAVTGYSWLGRISGKPKLIGVLVLLQPGSKTLTRVRSLGRMVRNVGLLFENTLLSQS